MNSSTTSTSNHSITSRPIKPRIFFRPLRLEKFAAAKHLLLCSVFFLLLLSNQLAAQYCAAGATDASGEKISNVSFSNINNSSSSTAGYEDFSSVYTVVEQGNIYAFLQPYPKYLNPFLKLAGQIAHSFAPSVMNADK